MRAVVQRVTSAHVCVEGRVISHIGRGLLVFLGVDRGDAAADLEYVAGKIRDLRIFSDEEGKMNRSVRDVAGEILVVSQFTLSADCRRGRRPSFDKAAPPEVARTMYYAFVSALEGMDLAVQTGQFQAIMRVELINDGPVTILLDSRKNF
jgi:D-tyrosyl-tRNA(Tyr) deacylase